MFSATKRPYTGGASAAAIELTLARVPVGVRDHLIHAWKSLETAAKTGTPDDMAARQARYARNRADCGHVWFHDSAEGWVRWTDDDDPHVLDVKRGYVQ